MALFTSNTVFVTCNMPPDTTKIAPPLLFDTLFKKLALFICEWILFKKKIADSVLA